MKNQTGGELAEGLAQSNSERTVEELLELGLPLYQNKGWLREALKEYGSVTGIAKATGYKRSVVAMAVSIHGLTNENPSRAYAVQRRAIKARVQAEWLTGGKPKDLAKSYGVSERTVYLWVQPLREGKK